MWSTNRRRRSKFRIATLNRRQLLERLFMPMNGLQFGKPRLTARLSRIAGFLQRHSRIRIAFRLTDGPCQSPHASSPLSALPQSRRFGHWPATSGLPPSTEMVSPARLVRFVPTAGPCRALLRLDLQPQPEHPLATVFSNFNDSELIKRPQAYRALVRCGLLTTTIGCRRKMECFSRYASILLQVHLDYGGSTASGRSLAQDCR